jgi:type IV pilus assembly protein PilA
MLTKLRNRMAREESGFTLIELLVVMLILGILAAIAIPAFLNQREKGQDADAKAGVRTMETAAETYLTDSNTGDYTGMDFADLAAVDAAVNDVPGVGAGDPADPTVTVTDAGEGYEIVVTSESDNTFTLDRAATGTKTRPCTGGGGCSGGTW